MDRTIPTDASATVALQSSFKNSGSNRKALAWCELREDFRHFRADRIAGLAVIEPRNPRRRLALLKARREIKGIASPP
jgi:predicted DNA-binding transcriptional regulator YafY